MVRRIPATVLTLVLLTSLGGAAGAQSEDDRAAPSPLFAVVMDPAGDGSGVFTAFERFGGGTVELIETDAGDGAVGGLLRLDPDPPGGDSFDVQTTGGAPEPGTPTSLQMATLSWQIASGSGVFEDLVGNGEVVTPFGPGAELGTGFYYGTAERATSASDVASQNWAAILSRFPDSSDVTKRANKAARTAPNKKGQLRKLRQQNQADIDFLDEIGIHPCYANAFDSLRFTLEEIDRGIASKLKNDPTADFELETAGSLAFEYELATSLGGDNRCASA